MTTSDWTVLRAEDEQAFLDRFWGFHDALLRSFALGVEEGQVATAQFDFTAMNRDSVWVPVSVRVTEPSSISFSWESSWDCVVQFSVTVGSDSHYGKSWFVLGESPDDVPTLQEVFRHPLHVVGEHLSYVVGDELARDA